MLFSAGRSIQLFYLFNLYFRYCSWIMFLQYYVIVGSQNIMISLICALDSKYFHMARSFLYFSGQITSPLGE